MENAIKIFRNKTDANKILKIFQDECPTNPREERDNLGIMYCRHSDYNLGDYKKTREFDSFEGSFEELETELIKNHDAVVVLPLRLYDHSGISISTSSSYPYNCRWDSSIIGYIYATRIDILKNFISKKITKKMIEKTKQILESEVETYNQYLTGDVYGFDMIEIQKCNLGYEHENSIDSCWGFYGDNFKENGLFESADIEIEEWQED